MHLVLNVTTAAVIFLILFLSSLWILLILSTQGIFTLLLNSSISTRIIFSLTLFVLLYTSMQQLRSRIQSSFSQLKAKTQHSLQHFFVLDDLLHQSMGIISALVGILILYAIPLSQSYRKQLIQRLVSHNNFEGEWKVWSQILYQPGGLYTLYQMFGCNKDMILLDHDKYNVHDAQYEDNNDDDNHDATSLVANDLQWNTETTEENHDLEPLSPLPQSHSHEYQHGKHSHLSLHSTELDSESDRTIATNHSQRHDEQPHIQPTKTRTHSSSSSSSSWIPMYHNIGKHLLSLFFTDATMDQYIKDIQRIGLVSGLLLGVQVKYSPVARTCLKNTIQRTIVMGLWSLFLGSIGSVYWKTRIWDTLRSTTTTTTTSNNNNNNNSTERKEEQHEIPKRMKTSIRILRDKLQRQQHPFTFQSSKVYQLWNQYVQKWKEDDQFRRQWKGILFMMILYVFRQGYEKKNKLNMMTNGSTRWKFQSSVGYKYS